MNENEVQLNQTRNITSQSRKPEIALRTLWLLAWFLIGGWACKGQRESGIHGGETQDTELQRHQHSHGEACSRSLTATGPCASGEPTGQTEQWCDLGPSAVMFPLSPLEDLWSLRLVNIDYCLCLRNCLQWNHEFVHFFSLSYPPHISPPKWQRKLALRFYHLCCENKETRTIYRADTSLFKGKVSSLWHH